MHTQRGQQQSCRRVEGSRSLARVAGHFKLCCSGGVNSSLLHDTMSPPPMLASLPMLSVRAHRRKQRLEKGSLRELHVGWRFQCTGAGLMSSLHDPQMAATVKSH